MRRSRRWPGPHALILEADGEPEHTVASLVAEGLSNPQIGQRLYISGRTVQTHLAHVFAKLDITARAQLAAEVSRHHAG
jgi:DNA-binding CsgD family transcriptional regulator